jgi:Zn-dependent protease with chaperone function
MTRTGQGIFFDGESTIRHEVTVEAAPDVLRVRAADGNVLAEWPYAEVEHLSAPEGVLRLGRIRSPVLARLEVRDADLAHAIDEYAVTVDRSGVSERRGRRKVVFWSVAAVASLLLVGIFAVPEIATRLAPMIPHSVERKLGDAVDIQVRRVLDPNIKGVSFICGEGAKEKSGRAQFDKLVARLLEAADLPIPVQVQVLRLPDANAIALPGGHVYVFKGLIDGARTPDELAGVIAHELGHVSHRDGTRSVLQAAGISLLFGMFLGDFVGGGAVVIAARTLLQTRYSRSVEAAADDFSVTVMTKVEGDPRALGAILQRIAGTTHGALRYLLSHPESKERMARIEAMAPKGAIRPLMTDGEWAELKRICAGS